MKRLHVVLRNVPTVQAAASFVLLSHNAYYKIIGIAGWSSIGFNLEHLHLMQAVKVRAHLPVTAPMKCGVSELIHWQVDRSKYFPSFCALNIPARMAQLKLKSQSNYNFTRPSRFVQLVKRIRDSPSSELNIEPP